MHEFYQVHVGKLLAEQQRKLDEVRALVLVLEENKSTKWVARKLRGILE